MSDDRWVSWAEASRLIGCSDKTVQAAVESGRIRRRPGSRPRGWASLETESVLAYAKVWGTQQAGLQAEQTARKAARAARNTTPPDDGQVWLSSAQVAALLSVTVGRVNQLAHAGSLPSTLKGHKRWFTRIHAEHFAAQRALPGWRPPPRGGHWSHPLQRPTTIDTEGPERL